MINNAEFSGYYFWTNLNIWGDFQICISVPLRTYINNLWLFTLKKSTFAKFKADFSVILRIFDLECLCHTSIKIEIVMFGFVFMEVRKLRSLYRENKEHNLHKT